MVFEKIVPIFWWFVCYWENFFFGVFNQLIVCWEELPDFYFFSMELISVSLQKKLARFPFAIEYLGWVDEFKMAIYNVDYRW